MRLSLVSLILLAANGLAVAATVEVRIEKMQFTPEAVHVKKGDTVIWTNHEKRGYHTVWFSVENIAESAPLFPGETWQRTFEHSGEHPYICGPHPQMTGKVVVE